MMERQELMNCSKKYDFWFFYKILIFVLLLLFFVYPLLNLFVKSMGLESGSFTFEHFYTFFTSKYYYQSFLRSIWVASVTTFFAILIGLPMAYFFSRYNFWGRRIVNSMIVLSLISSPFISAYSWIILLGRNGFLTNFLERFGINFPSIYGFGGMIFVFSLKFYPYIFLYVVGALSSMDYSLEDASESLGISKFKTFLNVTLPIIKPTIISASVIVFISTLSDFGIPMLIGEGYKVLPALIYDEYMSEIGGNYQMASTLSLIIVFCCFFVLLIQRYFDKKNYSISAFYSPKKIDLSFFRKFILSLFLFIISFVSFLPQIVVVVSSFLNSNLSIFTGGFGLKNYSNIFYRFSTSISNTFYFAICSLFLIVVIGVLTSRVVYNDKGKFSFLIELMLMLPYVIPGTVLGMSLLLAFNNKPFLFAGTSFIMILSYTIRKLPHTFKSSSAIIKQIDSSIEDASLSLGVNPITSFFKVTFMLMSPGIISGAILSWISILNELSSSIMLYSGKTSTISIAIYSEIIVANFGSAAALSSILTISTILSFVVFNFFSKGKISVI